METKNIALVGGIIIVAALTLFLLASKPVNNGAPAVPENNVSLVDGKQIITIKAKGGYYPEVTNAKAGVPTTIDLETQNTFDCSSSVVIPALKYQAVLPPSGKTVVEVPAQGVGTVLQGTCGMGMYRFTINFN